MIEAVSKNIKSIVAVRNEMQVKSLYLFGSGARETDFKEDSDLDFIYRFVKDESGYPISGFDYFDLLFKLEEITGRKVDLVAEEKIRNRFFFEKVKKEGVKIYES
ncbi:MAG: nucleotidyltransferase domain-containing protein [Chitinophagaceae bacterium]|nr:nucleotidyltransferase domain-containing protein [Chitinophagaceae bacterium]